MLVDGQFDKRKPLKELSWIFSYITNNNLWIVNIEVQKASFAFLIEIAWATWDSAWFFDQCLTILFSTITEEFSL